MDRASAAIDWITQRTAHIHDPRDRLAQEVGYLRWELRKAYLEIESLTEDTSPEQAQRDASAQAQDWARITRQDEARDWLVPV